MCTHLGAQSTSLQSSACHSSPTTEQCSQRRPAIGAVHQSPTNHIHGLCEAWCSSCWRRTRSCDQVQHKFCFTQSGSHTAVLKTVARVISLQQGHLSSEVLVPMRRAVVLHLIPLRACLPSADEVRCDGELFPQPACTRPASTLLVAAALVWKLHGVLQHRHLQGVSVRCRDVHLPCPQVSCAVQQGMAESLHCPQPFPPTDASARCGDICRRRR
mmetsp:Transcript_27033/g.50814  ORF Transcript_27033/g.50814 Transcript_27033/m.50814 type:complete len:215 (+) Transcript_27033:74-718(+)